MPSETEYSIHETSERLGIPIQKLRRWDEQGVLVAVRTTGGHRRYSKELIDRLAESAGATINDRASQELATVKRTLAEKRRIIQLLLESEARYRDLVETSHDLIWRTDAQGRFTYLNNAAQEIFGMTPQDLIGRCFLEFEAPSAHAANLRFIAELKQQGEMRNYTTQIVSTDGRDRWVGVNARMAYSASGEVLGIRGTARDITEQYLASARIEHLAMHDALTDLPNRHSLQRRIDQTFRSNGVGALLFLDIDYFKYINDDFGHRSGDELIVAVGSVLKQVARDANGELYRLGGDEFAIHLPGTLRRQAIEVAESALNAVRRYRFRVNEHRILSNVTVSIGIGLYPFHGQDAPMLVSNVDMAMYQAKELGRNRYTLFDGDAHSLRSTHRRIHWAKKLRDALTEDRLVLFAQPVVRLQDLKPMSHEVLVRIRDEQGSHILPADFVDLAEALGLIQEVDMRVVQKLLQFMRDNDLQGRKLRYFVNLSRSSISDERWIKQFLAMLQATDVDHGQLVFEIAETAAMSDIDVTLAFIRQLKQMGCRFALDKFGAGFSSFYYLKHFDVDYLKIDGSFIRDLATDEGCRIFVRALNEVAREVKKQVIAEWVETPETLKLLIQMGAQFGQGYLFRKPMPIAESLADAQSAATRRPGRRAARAGR